MTHTTRHVLLGAAWLAVAPILVVTLVFSGTLDRDSFRSFAAVASIVWGLGFVGIFASWALRDAPTHGKSKASAVAFSASWLLLSLLAVVPYLFYARGFRGGTLASLKYLSLCLALGILFVGVPSAIVRLF
jgi:hypothetical protein